MSVTPHRSDVGNAVEKAPRERNSETAALGSPLLLIVKSVDALALI